MQMEVVEAFKSGVQVIYFINVSQDHCDQIQHSFQMAFSANNISQLQEIGCLLIKF